MLPFKKLKVDLGRIPEFKPIKVEFPYNEGLKIIQIATYCGCSDARDIPKDSKITVTYTPQEVPIHLTQQGKFEADVKKKVDVKYDNGDGTQAEIVLYIQAVIYKKF